MRRHTGRAVRAGRGIVRGCVALALAAVACAATSAGAVAEVPREVTWSLVTDAPAFSPRDCAGALVFGGRMWLLGGWYPYADPKTNSEVWSSADGLAWQLETVAPWEGRHCAGYAVHDGKMWIVGGDNNRYHYQNDVWSSPDGIEWTQVAADVPWRDRVTHAVVSFHDRLWVLGGQQITYFDPDGGDAVYDDVWSSADGATWTLELAHAPWAARGQILGVAVFDDHMWLIGGGTYNDPRHYYRDVWKSADGVQWELVGKAPWTPRQYHNVTVFDGRLWVLGGYNDGNLGDVWSSTDGRHWRQMTEIIPSGTLLEAPWLPRHAGHVFVFDDALWMVGGSIHDSSPVADVWRMDLKPALACDPVPRADCVAARSPAGATLDLTDRSADAGDRVTWRFRGDASWVGNPQLDTGLALCLYPNGSAPPVLLGGALPAGLCEGKPCWDGAPGGFKYKDRQTWVAGTERMSLTSSSRGGTRATLRGRGPLLDLPDLASLATPFVVQLQGTHGVCWEAGFTAGGVRRQDAERLVATSG